MQYQLKTLLIVALVAAVTMAILTPFLRGLDADAQWKLLFASLLAIPLSALYSGIELYRGRSHRRRDGALLARIPTYAGKARVLRRVLLCVFYMVLQIAFVYLATHKYSDANSAATLMAFCVSIVVGYWRNASFEIRERAIAGVPWKDIQRAIWHRGKLTLCTSDAMPELRVPIEHREYVDGLLAAHQVSVGHVTSVDLKPAPRPRRLPASLHLPPVPPLSPD